MAQTPDDIFASLGQSLNAVRVEADDPGDREMADLHLEQANSLLRQISTELSFVIKPEIVERMQTHAERASLSVRNRDWGGALSETRDALAALPGRHGWKSPRVPMLADGAALQDEQLPDTAHWTPEHLSDVPK